MLKVSLLNGINLDVRLVVHAIMGPTDQAKALSSVIAGNEDYEVTDGDILKNENIVELSPEEKDTKE